MITRSITSGREHISVDSEKPGETSRKGKKMHEAFVGGEVGGEVGSFRAAWELSVG